MKLDMFSMCSVFFSENNYRRNSIRGLCSNKYPSPILDAKNADFSSKGALAWYGKLTWESAHAWILKILCYLIVWGITLIFMVRLSFYAIPLLIYDVMNDITIIP